MKMREPRQRLPLGERSRQGDGSYSDYTTVNHETENAMSLSRIMNLKTGLTTCPTCGAQYSWDIQVCPACVKRQEEAAAKQWSTDAEKAAQKAAGAEGAARLAQNVMSAFDAEMRRLCADYEPADDYHNEGAWK